MQHTYLVTLIDRETGQDQRILVRSENADGMQEFVNSLPDLELDHPVVMGVRQLALKRRLPRTNLLSVTA
ncbi:hypothetical protein SEA_PUPPER_104 [Gordonia phage Pupper]|uniref:Uncharacterized protein n=1 Tax=Gordonia phage Pupper TaxID=2571249 RepID=A0A4Y6EIM4_9CAUD|nr:hypothetical protein KHQ83_gp173 [Gordonia phage Pupper]QDF18590.1 hypothetical protein SEA_PUPPER_104 [Gordonia phage Pupper]QDF18822.1 hypothetical protein SEA_SCENTAE_103 [Gordonia phage SCentae]